MKKDILEVQKKKVFGNKGDLKKNVILVEEGKGMPLRMASSVAYWILSKPYVNGYSRILNTKTFAANKRTMNILEADHNGNKTGEALVDVYKV